MATAHRVLLVIAHSATAHRVLPVIAHSATAHRVLPVIAHSATARPAVALVAWVVALAVVPLAAAVVVVAAAATSVVVSGVQCLVPAVAIPDVVATRSIARVNCVHQTLLRAMVHVAVGARTARVQPF
jgi:hypothetical protein